MLKNAFLKKNCQNREPRWPPAYPHDVTPAYYCNFVEMVFSAKYVLLVFKMSEITKVYVLLLLLPHFCTYFPLKICSCS